jgi:hypothetical protein
MLCKLVCVECEGGFCYLGYESQALQSIKVILIQRSSEMKLPGERIFEAGSEDILALA